MDPRVEAHLDGELPAGELDEAARAEGEAFEATLGALRSALSRGNPPDAAARVMRRVAQLPAPAPVEGLSGLLRRWGAALLAPRELTLRLRPVHALGAAALAGALLVARPAPERAPSAAEAAAGASGPVYVQFRLQVDANRVELAGSFTGWEPTHALHQTADGVWTVLLAVEPGVHDYVFIVDGQRWMPDPYAPHVDDGFGGTNSRLTLLAPTRS